MARQFAFLGASLDELAYQPVRKGLDLRDTFRFCHESLGQSDREHLRRLFLFNDIKNVVLLYFRAKERQEDYQMPAYYTEEEYRNCRVDPLLALGFIQRWWDNQSRGIKLYPKLPHTDELTTFFYEDLDELVPNEFTRDWYLFELELRNFTVALTLEETGLDPVEKLIPFGTVYEDILAGQKARTTAGAVLGYLEELRDSGKGLKEAELLREQLRWTWIDERLGADWSSLDALLGHLVKLWSVERWEFLSPQHGYERFDTILDTMRRSIRFAVEFSGAQK